MSAKYVFFFFFFFFFLEAHYNPAILNFFQAQKNYFILDILITLVLFLVFQKHTHTHGIENFSSVLLNNWGEYTGVKFCKD